MHFLSVSKNLSTLVTRAPLNKCTQRKVFCTCKKGNQDVRVSEKRDIKMLLYCPKLDKLGLVDSRPSTNYFIPICPNKKSNSHMTHDPWHVTGDMLHVTFVGE